MECPPLARASALLASLLFLAAPVGGESFCPLVISGADELFARVLLEPWKIGPREELARLYGSVGGCEGAAWFYWTTVAVLRRDPSLMKDRTVPPGRPCPCSGSQANSFEIPFTTNRLELQRWLEKHFLLAKQRLLGEQPSCGDLSSLAWLGQAWVHLAGHVQVAASQQLEVIVRLNLLLGALPAHCTGRAPAEYSVAAAEMFLVLGDSPSAATACALAMGKQAREFSIRADQAARRGWLDSCVGAMWDAHWKGRPEP